MPSWTRSFPTRRPTSSRRWTASAPAPSAPEASAGPDQALSDPEFAGLLAPLGPFERVPHLAVAVSGGPDSLALCLLADRWARALSGMVTALIVDHGLRAESDAQAHQTAEWLERRGIRHHTMAWRGPKPSSGVQAAARAARYALLADWCRAAGALHLLLAHHRDDQAETVALRAARRSGADGLAGMAPVREIGGLRLLRPLLGVPKQRLVATLRAAGQAWIEDPSNRSPDFARGRLRLASPPELEAADADSKAAGRAALDRWVAVWLAAHARIDPVGFITLPRQALAEAPQEVAWRALQQALAAVGGSDYPPRSTRLDRLLRAMVEAPVGRTLAGCRILPHRADLLICREPAAMAPPLLLEPAVWQDWDRRFLVRWDGEQAGPKPMLRALGVDGWRLCKSLAGEPLPELPAPVRTGVPSVWQDDRLLAVAGIGLRGPRPAITFRFRPRQPLAGPPFVAAARTGPARPPYPRIAGPDTFVSV